MGKANLSGGGEGSIKKFTWCMKRSFRQGVYYGMKPSSGDDICGCDICWKARYDGTPGGAGVVQTRKMWGCGGSKLTRQVGYKICYKYVKYGGRIFVSFVCKIKDLSGVVVFSINNSSLIGDICLHPLCVVNRS